MKIKLKLLIPAAFTLAILVTACTKTTEQKVAGIWRIEDVKVDAAPGVIDMVNMDQTIKSQKEILYELHEDHVMKVKTGSVSLEGSWTFNQADNGIYVVFNGSFDTTLLGILKNKKLVNEQKDPQVSITTTFFKESKIKKEKAAEAKD